MGKQLLNVSSILGDHRSILEQAHGGADFVEVLLESVALINPGGAEDAVDEENGLAIPEDGEFALVHGSMLHRKLSKSNQPE